MRTIALFDLDGTLTRADTMLEFLYFTRGKARTWWLLAGVLPLWCLARLRLAPADAPKRTLVRKAFGTRLVGGLAQQAARFARERMPQLLRDGALDRITGLRQQGHEVFIVTASCSLWAAPWCQLHRLGCIATELEQEEGRYTGRLATPNCKGEEKVRRIRGLIGMDKVDYIHAFGDTASDRPMMALAAQQHYKPFRSTPA